MNLREQSEYVIKTLQDDKLGGKLKATFENEEIIHRIDEIMDSTSFQRAFDDVLVTMERMAQKSRFKNSKSNKFINVIKPDVFWDYVQKNLVATILTKALNDTIFNQDIEESIIEELRDLNFGTSIIYQTALKLIEIYY